MLRERLRPSNACRNGWLKQPSGRRPERWKPGRSLILSKRASRFQRLLRSGRTGDFAADHQRLPVRGAVHFLLRRRRRDPVFPRAAVTKEFFSSTRWYPSGSPPEFGAAAIFLRQLHGHAGAAAVAVPLGVVRGAVLERHPPLCDAAIGQAGDRNPGRDPSVAYGFFALVISRRCCRTRADRCCGWALGSSACP